ncbi:hypothetical protein NP493_736g00045 [Ridgeia piscesae]|uniref:Uncharacterized protein n=1 Tax=Ridgeia piscesae TaxID=27915 RepID=A0AAD9NMC0_RIDPI|nr:hypothetical protein NP493_736g00045 [Ridgeia piscesae]
MCIDFRRNRTDISPIVINGEHVEQVDSFKYLVRSEIILYRACYSRAKEISAATARSSKVASFLC